MLAPVLAAQTARRPRGVYTVVNIESALNQQTNLSSFFQGLLADPAISGLTLQVHWDTLNPNAPPAARAYDWSSLDAAFAQASSAKKTVQLIVTAGFQTPGWVLNQIPPCDGLFQSPVQTPPSTCGTMTFVGFSEGGDSTVLPLPWNVTYKSAWQTFLTALAARYGSNPAFVSIAVAGPTAASAEMILPNNGNSSNPQTQFGLPIAPTEMWRQLLAFQYAGMAAYQNSDQAFIDAWNAAIDMYGAIFSGVTLVATTGNGLPNFNNNNVTVPPGFEPDCGNPNMDCAAEATILAYFAESTVGGTNAKATQTSEMEASRANGPNLGVAGVKLLSQITEHFTTPSAQILGGAQFNTSFSNSTLTEGCTSTFPPNANDMPAGCTIPPTCTTQGCLPVACIPQACLAPGVTQASLAGYTKFSQVPAQYLIPPEQAEYNVLNYYFGGTAVASSFGGSPGATPAPLNYLQIYSPDIQYAQMNASAPAQVVETSGATISTTAQDLLNLASQKLLEIAEPPAFFNGEVWLGSGVYYLQFPNGNLFGYYNRQSLPILYHFDLGFESFIDAQDGSAGAFLYDFASAHWFYTSPSLFPYLFDFTLNAWLYYFPNTQSSGHYTTNPRYFSNLATSKVFTMEIGLRLPFTPDIARCDGSFTPLNVQSEDDERPSSASGFHAAYQKRQLRGEQNPWDGARRIRLPVPGNSHPACAQAVFAEL